MSGAARRDSIMSAVTMAGSGLLSHLPLVRRAGGCQAWFGSGDEDGLAGQPSSVGFLVDGCQVGQRAPLGDVDL